MGLPKVSVCMGCHTSVKTDSPHIQEVAKAAAEKRELRWKRVYQVPSYVYFSHRLHAEAGAECTVCHGPVAQRNVIFKEGDISMAGCMACHEQKGAPNDCNACHEPR
jgi:Fe-S cluster assembly scaffold protein SufB